MKYVAIDWLEIYVIEPAGFGIDALESAGFSVEVREYGTRIYHDVWTCVELDSGLSFEVRRGLKSLGVMPSGSAHLRATNKSCYMSNPAEFLWRVCELFGFTFRSISRVDIASDFVLFDSGISPKKFLKRVLNGSYRMALRTTRKDIVQCTWDNADPNYVSYMFGDVLVRLYDKSLELLQVSLSESKRKSYILALWLDFGLISSVHEFLADSLPHVYRLEFQIQSSSRGWVRDGDGKFMECTIDTLCSPALLSDLYLSMCSSYFQFHTYKKGAAASDASVVSLFDFRGSRASVLHPVRPQSVMDVDTKFKLLRFLSQIDSQISSSLSAPHRGSLMDVRDSLRALLRDADVPGHVVSEWRETLREANWPEIPDMF